MPKFPHSEAKPCPSPHRPRSERTYASPKRTIRQATSELALLEDLGSCSICRAIMTNPYVCVSSKDAHSPPPLNGTQARMWPQLLFTVFATILRIVPYQRPQSAFSPGAQEAFQRRLPEGTKILCRSYSSGQTDPGPPPSSRRIFSIPMPWLRAYVWQGTRCQLCSSQSPGKLGKPAPWPSTRDLAGFCPSLPLSRSFLNG